MSSKLVQLSEVCEIIMGQAPAGSSYNEHGEGIALIAGAGDFGKLTPEPKKHTTEPSKFSHVGDLILCIRATIGELNLSDKKYCLGRGVAGLRPNENVLHCAYLWHFIKSSKQQLAAKGTGSTFKQVSRSHIAEWEIPLPPLPEQKRIAAILDKADAIRRKRQQAIQLADDFLRAVFLDMFGDPVTNPKGWDVKPLKEIARIQIGPFGTQLHKEEYITGGIPLVNPTHLVQGKIVPNHELTVSKTKHAELSEYHLDEGDIVMGRRGEMGRCAVVGKKESGWLCGTGSLFLRPKQAGVFSGYLGRLLSSEPIKRHLESESLGATMPNLNKSIVGNIMIPIPSDSALKQFAEVERKTKSFKAKYSKLDEEIFFESLSNKAFSGHHITS